jgi:hypothetical protein
VSGQVEPGAPPPEVPEEFAAAYRAAFEQAMAAQSTPTQDGDHVMPELDEVGLPRRTRRTLVGTHRAPGRDVGAVRDRPTLFERSRESGWLAPVLLVLLLLILILGSYLLGRTFAAHVGSQSPQTSALCLRGSATTG